MPKKDESESGSPTIPDELIDQLLGGYRKPEELTGPNGLIKQLVAKLVTRAMNAELDHHLGYPPGESPPEGQTNRRNGKRSKTLRSDAGPIPIDVPRDREGTFEPKIVGKHERHFSGFDDKILSMYARGMSVRDIQRHLHEIYGVEVSPDLISKVTDAVIEELRAWQSRPLEPVYLIVYIDALITKIRDKGMVQNKAIYTVMGISPDGRKDILGFWVQATEGAKFWLNILGELRQRGVQDILVICADGLTGIAEAIEAAFPKAIHQTCIVHMIRNSTRLVPWKDRKAVCADLREVYTAADAVAAAQALDAVEAKWGKRFPMIVPSWRRRWAEVVPFLAFPPEIRHAIYTTNAVESFHAQLRKALKTRGHLPNDDAALKLLYLAARHVTTRMNKSRDWATSAMQFAIYFEDESASDHEPSTSYTEFLTRSDEVPKALLGYFQNLPAPQAVSQPTQPTSPSATPPTTTQPATPLASQPATSSQPTSPPATPPTTPQPPALPRHFLSHSRVQEG